MTIGFNNLSSLLSQYGVGNTGNIQTDLAALKTAMQAKGESTSSIDSFASFISQVNKTKGHGHHKKVDQTQDADKTQDAQKTQQGQQAGPPWASLMQQLGLELQGSPEADFAAMSQKLSEMSSSATTPEQKANIASLQSQFEQYQNQAPQGAGGGMGASSFQNSMLQNLVNNNQQQGQSTGQNGNPGFTLPWNSLLQSVGLSSQGSPSADFAAISQKLTEMKAADTTGANQTTIAALQTKLAQYKNQTQAMVVRG